MKYKLIMRSNTLRDTMKKSALILNDVQTSKIWKKRRQHMLSEKEDFNSFVIDFVQNLDTKAKIL